MNARLSASSAAVVLLLLASPAFCQMTGTSHPEALDDAITTDQPAQTSPHYVKPLAGIPMPAASDVQPQPAPQFRERQSTDSSAVVAYPAQAYPAQNEGYEPQTAMVRHAEPTFAVTDDVNSGVVIDVPSRPDELPEGAVLRAALVSPLATDSSRVGSRFAAALSADVRHYGRVVLPAGTLVQGRVTEVHGGRRISGAPSIRLQPETLLLPDGASYRIAAEVIDLDHFMDSRVNSEGSIVANEHAKATLGTLGFTTGTAAVAGAVIGGGVGAVVGASIGAGVGTIWWLKKDRQETLPTGTEIVFSLDRPLGFGPAAR